MRTLPAGMQAHLDSGATTLCTCWRLVRNNGAVLGFTDHDRPLSFGGVTYEAAAGFTATEIDSSVGLGVDNLEVESVLKSDRLNETDLAAGLFDNAEIEIYRVNWADVAQRVLLRSGSIGEVSRGQYAFKAEVRGLAHELQQEKGRIFQFQCDADLGDTRCGVDLDSGAFKGSGSVAALKGPRSFTASGLGAFANDWFTHGLLTWTSGANDGRSMEVKLHLKHSGTVTLELWQRMAEGIEPGDDFEIRSGCDKQFATCKAKFDNIANYRGFPHIPGNDYAISYRTRTIRRWTAAACSNERRSFLGGKREGANVGGDLGILRGERFGVAELDVFADDDAGPLRAAA
jgi:uncharacterized phage protein (TIGR02218 family)